MRVEHGHVRSTLVRTPTHLSPACASYVALCASFSRFPALPDNDIAGVMRQPGATPAFWPLRRHKPLPRSSPSLWGSPRAVRTRIAFIEGEPMRTYIQPLKKSTEDEIKVRVDHEVARGLRDYCEFLQSPQSYVVTEVLRKALRKDKAFTAWLSGAIRLRPSADAPAKSRKGADCTSQLKQFRNKLPCEY